MLSLTQTSKASNFRMNNQKIPSSYGNVLIEVGWYRVLVKTVSTAAKEHSE